MQADSLTELAAAGRIAISALIGLGVGLEREWSAHGRSASVHARFAGLRTFALMGAISGVAGALLALSYFAAAVVIMVATMGLIVAAYVMAVRADHTDLDGTTETAALGVVTLGVLAGAGWMTLASGAGALMVLVLREKTRLHALVARIDESEFRAALQFAVLALVVLPLLPAGPFGGALNIRPQSLWIVVLLFSGINYAGHIARRILGPERGFGVAGALGGIVSSTAVSLTHARQSRKHPQFASPLARGVIAACVVLGVRVIIVSGAINGDVARKLAPMIAPQILVGALAVLLWRGRDRPRSKDETGTEGSPLGLKSAILMAVAFQVAMIAVEFASEYWGAKGAYASGAVLGLTDMDALTFSMSRPESGLAPELAARVIVVGIVANSVLKWAAALILGENRFRVAASAGFAMLIAAAVAGLML